MTESSQCQTCVSVCAKDNPKPSFGADLDGTKLHQPESTDQGTLICGPIPGQPALHGVFDRLQNLNLTIITVRKLENEVENDRKSAFNA